MEPTPTQPLSSESMLGSAALRILHLASLQWVFGAEPGGKSDRRFGIFTVHSGSADPGHCASLASCLSRRSAQSRGGTQSAQPGHLPADNGCSVHCVYAASRRFWDFPALSKKKQAALSSLAKCCDALLPRIYGSFLLRGQKGKEGALPGATVSGNSCTSGAKTVKPGSVSVMRNAKRVGGECRQILQSGVDTNLSSAMRLTGAVQMCYHAY